MGSLVSWNMEGKENVIQNDSRSLVVLLGHCSLRLCNGILERAVMQSNGRKWRKARSQLTVSKQRRRAWCTHETFVAPCQFQRKKTRLSRSLGIPATVVIRESRFLYAYTCTTIYTRVVFGTVKQWHEDIRPGSSDIPTIIAYLLVMFEYTWSRLPVSFNPPSLRSLVPMVRWLFTWLDPSRHTLFLSLVILVFWSFMECDLVVVVGTKPLYQ